LKSKICCCSLNFASRCEAANEIEDFLEIKDFKSKQEDYNQKQERTKITSLNQRFKPKAKS
jgi:hypothetical protein